MPAFPCSGPARNRTGFGNRVAAIVAEIHNPRSKTSSWLRTGAYWRNYPENSDRRHRIGDRHGRDIMELGPETHEGQWYGALPRLDDRPHDFGKGRVCAHHLRPRFAVQKGRRSRRKMTHCGAEGTREALEVCKDRSWSMSTRVTSTTTCAGRHGRSWASRIRFWIKGQGQHGCRAAKFAEHPRNMMYADHRHPCCRQGAFRRVSGKGIAPLAYEVCWNKYHPRR